MESYTWCRWLFVTLFILSLILASTTAGAITKPAVGPLNIIASQMLSVALTPVPTLATVRATDPKTVRVRPPDDNCREAVSNLPRTNAAPTPFLYKPFDMRWSANIWTSTMDHETPNYRRQYHNVASLGERVTGDPLTYTYEKTKYVYYYSPSLELFFGYEGHDGHDFATPNDNATYWARAAAGGEVITITHNKDCLGNFVDIFHPEGYLTRYAHLKTIDVAANSTVSAGDRIGIIGRSGCCTGPHLHFAVYHWNSAEKSWEVTDPFGWDPWLAPDQQGDDPLRNCNGEISHNLWVGGWPQAVDGSPGVAIFPEVRFVGGWLVQENVDQGDPGQRILYVTEFPPFGNSVISMVRADGTGLTSLTDGHTKVGDPTWSPDGQRIAFWSVEDTNPEGQGRWEIRVMNADGSDVRRLTYGSGVGQGSEGSIKPTWVSDGRLAFLTYRRDHGWDIDAIDPYSGNRETLMQNASYFESIVTQFMESGLGYPCNGALCISDSMDRKISSEWVKSLPEWEWMGLEQRTIAWSPDALYLAFESNTSGDPWADKGIEIFVMNVDGSGLEQLTDNTGGDWAPVWSPDGEQIAFESTRDNNREIYVMNADGSDQRNLTNHPSDDRSPTWSADGSQIAFWSDRGHDESILNFDIYVMRADGSGLTRLTSSEEGVGLSPPIWAP